MEDVRKFLITVKIEQEEVLQVEAKDEDDALHRFNCGFGQTYYRAREKSRTVERIEETR